MKTKFALIMIMALIVASCGDDEDTAYKCKSCVDTPEASAANDASGQGIYKGLVVGSSGTIKFDINNSGTYSATLELDGETYELTTEDTYNSEGGFYGCFYGTMSTTDDIEICFYASFNGSSYYVEYIDIPGHPDATIEVYKEYSDALVAVYEGEFSGDSNGVFNMIVQDGEWEVLARENSSDYDSYFYGTESNGTMTCQGCQEVEITGKINNDEASGKWSAGTDNGSWKGKRTL